MKFFHIKNTKLLKSFLFAFILLNGLKLTIYSIILTHFTLDWTVGKFIFSVGLAGFIFSLCIKKWKKGIFIAIYLIQFLYCFTILANYLYFNNYLNVFTAFSLFNETMEVAKGMGIPLYPQYLYLLIDFPFFILILSNYGKLKKIFTNKINIKKYSFKFSSIIMIISFLFLSVQQIVYISDETISSIKNNRFAGQATMVFFYGTFINSFVDIISSNSEKELVKQFKYGELVNYKNSDYDINNAPNIIVIQVESLESNVINYKYKGKYVAPYLNSLTKESIYYPFTFSYHLRGGTSDAEMSTINNFETLSNYPTCKLRNYDYPNSLVKQLNKNGYNTYGFHGNDGTFFNRISSYGKMGFKGFYDIRKLNLDIGRMGDSDKYLFDKIYNLNKTHNNPFFHYIITYTSHTNFSMVNKFDKEDRYPEITHTRTRQFMKSIRYTDEAIKEYVTKIRKLYPNTYIYIFGDHTPRLNGKYLNESFIKHERKLFEFVPLFIITPNNEKRIVKKPACFHDIGYTILKSSNGNFSYKTYGENLLKEISMKNKFPYLGAWYTREDFQNLIDLIKKRNSIEID